MKILVTGSKGYIASYLLQKLKKTQHSLILLDKKNSKRENITHIHTINLLKKEKIDLIYHLAAQTSVQKSFENSKQNIIDNIIGTINLLTLHCPIIFTSTAAVYGNVHLATENSKCNPQSPYAINKLAAEKYIVNSNISYVICRLSNVYGRNNNKGIFEELSNTGKIFGNGLHTRDYIYIDDVLNALVQAQNWFSGIYNIGTGVETSVNSIADLLNIKKIYTTAVVEQQFISLNILKAKAQKWSPLYELKEYYNK